MIEQGKLLQILLNLPHPLEFIWLIWLVFLPSRIAYMWRSIRGPVKLHKGGELFSFGEIAAVGCVGGFPILTFIFLYTASITLRLAGII